MKTIFKEGGYELLINNAFSSLKIVTPTGILLGERQPKKQDSALVYSFKYEGKGISTFNTYHWHDITGNCQVGSMASFVMFLRYKEGLKVSDKFKNKLFELILAICSGTKNMILLDVYEQYIPTLHKAVRNSEYIHRANFFKYTNTRGTKMCMYLLDVKELRYAVGKGIYK